MGALIAGAAVLVLLLLLLQGFVTADAKSLARGMRIVGAVILAFIAAGLALSGRIAFAVIAASIAAAIFTGGPMPWKFAKGYGAGASPRGSSMSQAEALKVLGLEPGASEEDIRAAYHRLMQQSHPDKGGTSYLAAKINEAKDVLLGK